jgi:hypothetical protein
MAAARNRSPAQCLLAAVLLAAVLLASGCTFDPSGRPFDPADGGADGYVPPTCGNGVMDGADGEQCDGSDLGGATCESLGYSGGTLSCTPQCALDESLCEAPENCGDGVLDPDEECDGAALGGATCASETTFTEGLLTCRASCVLDTSACHTCGDGSVDGPEGCDGANTTTRPTGSTWTAPIARPSPSIPPRWTPPWQASPSWSP